MFPAHAEYSYFSADFKISYAMIKEYSQRMWCQITPIWSFTISSENWKKKSSWIATRKYKRSAYNCAGPFEIKKRSLSSKFYGSSQRRDVQFTSFCGRILKLLTVTQRIQCRVTAIRILPLTLCFPSIRTFVPFFSNVCPFVLNFSRV